MGIGCVQCPSAVHFMDTIRHFLLCFLYNMSESQSRQQVVVRISYSKEGKHNNPKVTGVTGVMVTLRASWRRKVRQRIHEVAYSQN